MKIDDYRKIVLENIAKLRVKMKATRKKDNAQWKRYRMQIIAYKARLRKRQHN